MIVLATDQAVPDQVSTWTWPEVYSATTAVSPSGVVWTALTSFEAVPMVTAVPAVRVLSASG